MLNTIFRGWKVVSIHGDKAQHDRTKALYLFKNGSCPLMVTYFTLELLLAQKLEQIYELVFMFDCFLHDIVALLENGYFLLIIL